MINRWFAKNIIAIYTRNELPGWGHIYRTFVGDYRKNNAWASDGPKLLRDKRYKYFRILYLREWADRSFFFLKRWYDLPAQLLVDKIIYSGDVVVDVGANYGHFSLSAAYNVGCEGRVYSFEPNPKTFRRLQMHVEMNQLGQIRTHNMGLADKDGELTLSVPMINSGEASFTGIPYKDVVEVTCPIGMLDDQKFEGSVKLIKIDVEGFEERVLNGGKALIEKDQPLIVTEVVRSHLERAGSDPDSIQDFFEKIGYKGYRIELFRSILQNKLRLTPIDSNIKDGDYIWFPEKKFQELRNLFSALI